MASVKFMNNFELLKDEIKKTPKVWLVTGVAGFIGSNLLETLLQLDQKVIGLDNFSTGYQRNLDEVMQIVTDEQWDLFTFIEGDIRDYSTCLSATRDVDYVLHEAALGSVPRSLNDPMTSNSVNIDGFLNMLNASRVNNVKSFTYAASSSTYGDHPALPKVEEAIGNPLSPYAVTKYVNELYAKVYARSYDFKSIGLRYFNVFGKRQDPDGAYAAVIPKWTSSLLKNEPIYINGDGTTSRDFCFIENVIQMNILAAVADDEAKDQVYNTAVGDRMTLNSLFEAIKASLVEIGTNIDTAPTYRDFRIGDVKHSQADITKAKKMLGYEPGYNARDGLEKSISWYKEFLS